MPGKTSAVQGTFAPRTPVRRPTVEGKFLFEGPDKLFLKGATYGTFRPGPDGEPFPIPQVVRTDFDAMAASGFNTVRTYTVPTVEVMDLALDAGLRVLVGLPWEQHIAFTDDRARMRGIRRRVGERAATCAGHPALLGFAVGNEIPASIVRWSGRRRIERFLSELADVVRAQDPEALVTYANFPTTEYLELPFLDFHCFNVYLECPSRFEAYLARLQNVAGERPLVLGELGLDSRRNGEREQARALGRQLQVGFESGAAGAFVFSWTDEWHRGGHEVEDWDFGLTTRQREPKPALQAVRAAWKDLPHSRSAPKPRVSVVVCVYNAESTLRDTLDGLGRLDYPNFETIVIDDGSTDGTAAIAAEFPVRLIRTENRGLSAARNLGLAEATGQIVAYIDGDAWPDPDWLTYLAHSFTQGGWVGVGGPNLPPPGDGPIAACVANAPGGPVHVLLSDREAEHIPGCNMAFWRSALEEVGGFDPRFRAAGDDVDLCWRLQEKGWKLGYNAAAVVWHHHRNSARAYWRQQWGYGKAEALLESKWPEKYNSAGHVTWGGRVYGRSAPSLLGWVSRVYQGTWGDAPFQRIHLNEPGVVLAMASTPEWYLLILLLAALSALGVVWPPLLTAVPFLALAFGTLVLRALRAARRARFDEVPRSRGGRIMLRAVTASFYLLQPLARLGGRLSEGLTPWRLRTPETFRFPVPRSARLWSERWESVAGRLRTVEEALRANGAVVRRGDAYARWDLELRGGAAGWARIRTCVEEHGEGRQLIRFRIWPGVSGIVLLFVLALTVLGSWAAAAGAWAAGAALGSLAALATVRAMRECGMAVGVGLAALESMDPMPSAPEEQQEEEVSEPAGIGPSPRRESSTPSLVSHPLPEPLAAVRPVHARSGG